jgi:[acyl-carrier-protein] S-malonyltransferase
MFSDMKMKPRLNPDGREWSIPELLELQVQRPVRMEDWTFAGCLRLVVDQFVEIGPGKTLAGFVRKTAKDMGISTYEVVSLETAEELERYHG